MKQILAGAFFFLAFNISAQEKMVADTNSVKSIHGIVKEVLRIISGEQGKTRNWDAFKNLFLPTAHFTVHSHDKTNPQPVETASLPEFIDAMNDTYYDKGFLEYEISKVVDEYNGIAHVFQSFYAKDSENHEERGITSYQLVYFKNRWWIANIVWTGDSNGVKVPEKYLKK
jgi:hypothetical protein